MMKNNSRKQKQKNIRVKTVQTKMEKEIDTPAGLTLCGCELWTGLLMF